MTLDKQKRVNFFVWNARSLNNKSESVMQYLGDHNIDLAFVSETWLTDQSNVTTANIKSFGYDIIHSFRHDARGGGTAIIFKSILSVNPVNLATNDITSFGYISGCVKCLADVNLLLLCIYRTGPTNQKFFDDLNNLLSSASLKSDYIVIGGDFNIHMENSTAHSDELLDVTSSYGFELLFNDIPTHVDGGSIDLVFYTSNLLDKKLVTVISDFNKSDHFPIVVPSVVLEVSQKATKQICFRDLRNEQVVQKLNTSIIKYLEMSTLNIHGCFKTVVYSFFKDIIAILDTYAPLVTKTITTVASAPWFDSEYKKQRSLRRKAERKWRKTRDERDEIFFREAEERTLEMINFKKQQYYRTKIEDANGDPRMIYQVVNQEFDRKCQPPLPDAEDLEKLAQDFNNFFIEKIKKIRENFSFIDPNHVAASDVLPNAIVFSQEGYLNEFEVCTVEELKDIIKESGIKCAPTDFLPTQILKQNIDPFLPVLCKIVNLSLEEGSIDGLKIADIIPTLKDASLDPNEYKNYRPISNLSFLGKLIERVVLRRLNAHMNKNNMEIPEQSAYKKFNSTETIMVKVINDLLISFDSKSATVLIMLDLSAAFDTVSHKKLMNILRDEIKIGGKALKWFGSFLQGRTQRTRLGSVLSDSIVLLFGVPQGSVLGPVLFNIYIRSLYSTIKRTGFCVQGYADDQQIYKSFKPCDQVKILCMDVINCFKTIKNWMLDFHLQLNTGKTKIAVLAPPKVLNEIKIHGVYLTESACIRFVSTVKSLGVHIDEHLTLKNHIVSVKKESFSVLRNICKRKNLFTESQLKLIVNSLVVCKLDYCNAIYYGINEKQLNELQIIQNAAARTIMGLYKYDHLGESLEKLHWLPIRSRVKYKILLLVYKCLNGMAPDYLASMITYTNYNHCLYLKEATSNAMAGERTFEKAGPKLWNRLPSSVKSCSSITSFKTALKTFLFQEAYN